MKNTHRNTTVKQTKNSPSTQWLSAKAGGGQTYHLQQKYWTGAIVAGPWGRGPGNVTLKEIVPSYDYPPTITRKVVAAIVTVPSPGTSTIIVEDGFIWPASLQVVGLLKVATRLTANAAATMLEQGLIRPAELLLLAGVPHLLNRLPCAEEKIITLDCVPYLRIKFSIPKRRIPPAILNALGNVRRFGVHSGTVDCLRIQAQIVAPPIGYSGWLGSGNAVRRYWQLEIVQIFSVPSTGTELDYYLQARAAKYAKDRAFTQTH